MSIRISSMRIRGKETNVQIVPQLTSKSAGEKGA